jgi:hypothetical protein
MSDTIQVPSTQKIRAQMQACRDELTALKKLLRVAEAAEQAEQARRDHQTAAGGEVRHGA